ncbi:hypothetical protein KGP36_06965 [Patescibacteria group bacterium]|nr:hypothetical protein [Patescibacteria group bacterium]
MEERPESTTNPENILADLVIANRQLAQQEWLLLEANVRVKVLSKMIVELIDKAKDEVSPKQRHLLEEIKDTLTTTGDKG